MLTFLDICSFLGLGGGCLCSALGQDGEEAEEQVGAPKSHTAASGCNAWVRKQWSLQPARHVLRLWTQGPLPWKPSENLAEDMQNGEKSEASLPKEKGFGAIATRLWTQQFG